MPTTTTITPALYERLVDRLRHEEQYLEAARLMASDARELLEATHEGENANGGAPDA
jgi:hypothetical protein